MQPLQPEQCQRLLRAHLQFRRVFQYAPFPTYKEHWSDFAATLNLDASRCAPTYDGNASTIEAVNSAIESGVAAARAAVKGRDPTKLGDLPFCAVNPLPPPIP